METRRPRSVPSVFRLPDTSAPSPKCLRLPASARTSNNGLRVGRLRTRLTVAEGSPVPSSSPATPRTTSTRS
ncbi:hypothetical protein ACFX50_01955 [Neisseria meningitidis]